MPDFIGGDPESNANECPAVWVSPDTGDFLFRGKTVTDAVVLDELNGHIGKADDESDVWLPARMADLIRQALDGYERGRQGPGQHTFAELLAATSSGALQLPPAPCVRTNPPLAAPSGRCMKPRTPSLSNGTICGIWRPTIRP